MKFTGFEGEENQICHSVRDGTRIHRGPTRDSYDVVVVGAGISGLTAAYRLKNRLSVRILEKEKTVGGASKRGNWRGIYYSHGTADTAPSYEIQYEGKKIDFLAPLFRELNIQWQKVADPSDAFMFRNHFVLDPFCRCNVDLPASGEERKGFEDAVAYIGKIKEEHGEPTIPPEASTAKALELDNRNLREMFTRFGDYFLLFLETYSRSTFGAPASEISAYEGVHYLIQEMRERYSCPGGNACVSEALASRLENKIEVNSTVAAIEQDKDSYYVTYVDKQGSEVTIQSRAVVVTCPKHFVPYMIRDLPEDQKRAFRQVRYDSYIVANVLTNDTIYDKAFATYFDDTIFTDIVIADWITTGGKKRTNSGEPEVYTLYCPMGQEGRYRVLTEPAETWIAQILDGLKKYFPGIEQQIADIRLYRYGHHYVIGYPGFITGPRTIVKRPFGNIFFARDDTQGIPCLEGAVWSGIEAANKILEKMA